MARLIYRPLREWSDELTDDNDRSSTSRFKSKQGVVPLRKTEQLLRREADMLDASDVIIEVDLPERAFYSDGTGVKGNARQPDFPGVIVRLIGTRFGDLRYSCDEFTQRWQGEMPGWAANLRAIALGLDALRQVERYGIARRGEQYVGWGELPPGTPMSAGGAQRPQMTLDRAAAVLAGATDGLVTAPNVLSDPDDARLAYRMAAKRWHPDAYGGSADTWAQVDEAWQLIEKHHSADH